MKRLAALFPIVLALGARMAATGVVTGNFVSGSRNGMEIGPALGVYKPA